jgi:hypothetical protein
VSNKRDKNYDLMPLQPLTEHVGAKRRGEVSEVPSYVIATLDTPSKGASNVQISELINPNQNFTFWFSFFFFSPRLRSGKGAYMRDTLVPLRRWRTQPRTIMAMLKIKPRNWKT